MFSKAKQRLPPTTPGEVRDPPRNSRAETFGPFKLSGGNNNTV